jgi:UDP-glucose 4-epimerase
MCPREDHPALTGAESSVRVLVTGGAGFIGSHLTEALLAMGHEVVVLDDLSTGRAENLQAVQDHPRLEVVTGSVTDEAVVRKLMLGVDVVYHLAAAVGVQLILDRPVSTIETNIVGTETVLRAACDTRPRVVIASTSEVYGKNDRVPLSEDDDRLLGPTTKSRWSYACSKAIDEFLALAYHREYQLPVTIVRFFNTIGPRQTGRYGMVVPRFVRQAIDGQPITVYGDGRQSRCFTDVEDVVRATIALSLAPAAVGEVFNIGTANELTVADLAARVRHLTGSASPLVFVPYDEAYQPGFEDLRRRVPDLRKLERAIAYKPQVSLDETLRRVILFLRETGRR